MNKAEDINIKIKSYPHVAHRYKLLENDKLRFLEYIILIKLEARKVDNSIKNLWLGYQIGTYETTLFDLKFLKKASIPNVTEFKNSILKNASIGYSSIFHIAVNKVLSYNTDETYAHQILFDSNDKLTYDFYPNERSYEAKRIMLDELYNGFVYNDSTSSNYPFDKDILFIKLREDRVKVDKTFIIERFLLELETFNYRTKPGYGFTTGVAIYEWIKDYINELSVDYTMDVDNRIFTVLIEQMEVVTALTYYCEINNLHIETELVNNIEKLRMIKLLCQKNRIYINRLVSVTDKKTKSLELKNLTTELDDLSISIKRVYQLIIESLIEKQKNQGNKIEA